MKYLFIPKLLGSLVTMGFLLMGAHTAVAQDQTVSELKKSTEKKIERAKIDSGKVWKKRGVYNLNIGQGNQKNWAAGGDDFSFTLNTYLGLQAFYKKERYTWDNTLDFNYGFLNTTTLGTRKNDDRIDLLTKVGYELKPKLNVSALMNFHSQFTKGYNYLSDGKKELLSDFLSPGYLLLSAGIDYRPAEGLSLFISPITARWTFVRNDELSAKGAYGVDSLKHVHAELGAFASVRYDKEITERIKYNGRADFFSNYGHNPQNVDVTMTNMFTAKFSKVLAASLALNLIYDDDVKMFGPYKRSPALQLQSLIAVGLSVKF